MRCGECPTRSPDRLLWLGLVVLLQPGWAAAADAPALRISGAANLATETRLTADGFEVRATLADEVGRPLSNAEIHARATTRDGVPQLQRCGQGRGEGESRLSLTTDPSGRVCVSVKGMLTGSLDLSYDDPRGYFERTTRSVALPDSANGAFEVGFDPPVSALPLDRPLQAIGIVARAKAGAKLPDSSELVLSLAEGGSERELTRIALDGLGEVHRLSLVSATFGAPGPARLVARLRTRSGEERAMTSVAVLRTATVGLALDEAVRAEGIEAGTTLEVRAASALGPTPSGTVEARSDGRSIAAAPVRRGKATLTLPPQTVAPLGKSLTLEYVGEGPGWLSGPPLELDARPPARSYARYLPWIAAAALAALAVVLGWRRPARPRPSLPPPPSRARASVEVIESFGSGRGYQGMVCDAHEGTPISPAVVSIVTPGPHPRVVAQVRTSGDGTFGIEAPHLPEGALVEVTALYHATLIATLPGPGVLKLSLVTRRRALLDRLVRWAERRGVPWTRPGGDPTPAQVASVAESESEVTVGRWARAVEQLAYGPNSLDAAGEQAAGVAEDPKTIRERDVS